jgi:iron complex outermembrane receptor protein
VAGFVPPRQLSGPGRNPLQHSTSSTAGIRVFPPVVPRRWVLGAAILVFLLLHARPVEAQFQTTRSDQSLTQLSLEELRSVEVTTVSKNPQKILQTPAAIFVITQEDIRRSAATSIPEALRMAPGVEVARIDANHWSVAIRGFAGQFSKSLLVLVDGRSIYTPLFEGVYWDLPYVMLEDVDRIEVIRGPGGTIWGSNAVNGVINIITKNAKTTHGALATLGGGKVDQGTGAFRYGGSAGKDFDYRVYGMGEIRGTEFHPDGNGFDHWRMGQMGFRTDWRGGAKDTFTVQSDMYRGESGESIQIGSLSPAAETAERGEDFVSGGNLLARWQHMEKALTDRFKPTSTGPTGRTSSLVRRGIRLMLISSTTRAFTTTKSYPGAWGQG